MNVERLPNEKKLALCKKYYFVGFALLPFMWAVNAVWFFNEAFRRPAFNEQKQMKKYVIISGIGALAWLVGMITWAIMFQEKRSSWGATGDYMSFVIPKGVP